MEVYLNQVSPQAKDGKSIKHYPGLKILLYIKLGRDKHIG